MKRRIEQPAELADADRPLPLGRVIQAPRTLYEDLYHEEREARDRVVALMRPALTTAIARGITLGYAVAPSANGWLASALAACALTLHMQAARVARRVQRHD